jgi:hypothetical protein
MIVWYMVVDTLDTDAPRDELDYPVGEQRYYG